MEKKSSATRVRKHRDHLRARGLRPIQLWVPDTRQAEFAEEAHRQSLLCVASDEKDEDLGVFMEDALKEIDGWTA